MKIPFDIKYRPQIESGEYKVETGTGKKVRIICWDKKSDKNKKKIVALLDDGNSEHTEYFTEKGTVYDKATAGGDLFIITPEPELSEFEKAVGLEIFDEPFEERHIKVIKEESAKLLALAREQIIKDGYVIEKKAFHDAVGKVAPEVMKEVSDKVDMEEAIRLGYEKGRAEVLKNLPRWKKCDNNTIYNTKFNLVENGVGRFLMVEGYQIGIDSLEKLPGFNE